MLLKREIGPKIVGNEGDRGGSLIGRGNDSLGRRRSFGIGHELSLILPRFPLFPSHDFRRDRPRSTTIVA